MTSQRHWIRGLVPLLSLREALQTPSKCCVAGFFTVFRDESVVCQRLSSTCRQNASQVPADLWEKKPPPQTARNFQEIENAFQLASA